MGEVVETIATIGPFTTAIVGVVLLVGRRARSTLSVALCVAFIALAVAFGWWLARWFGESCPDQPDLGTCGDLDRVFAAMGGAWGLLVLAGVVVLIRARSATPRHSVAE